MQSQSEEVKFSISGKNIIIINYTCWTMICFTTRKTAKIIIVIPVSEGGVIGMLVSEGL